jgi:hypothetical protein
MDMRHPEPEIVTLYLKTLRAEPPKVCHLCDNYNKHGICDEFNDVPPESFASEPNQCELWVEVVPF